MSRFVVICVLLAVLAGACLGEELSLEARIGGREFPSVFQAWSGVEGVKGTGLEKTAMHDLVWHGVSWFGLAWDSRPLGLSEKIVAGSVRSAMAMRQRLMKLNPNIVMIAEIRYRDAHKSFLGEGHKWWARDSKGEIEAGWEEGGFLKLDFHNPEYREHVARRAGAIAATGAMDGIMLDWWSDDEDRLDLIKRVRKAVGEDFLIIANANDRQTPQTAPYINGYFMECYRSSTAEDWKRITETLSWASKNLRSPRVNCLEVWYHNSRDDLNLMRATTTLSLTHSNGYCLFSDPNPLPTPDHRHNWYGFWDRSLGKAVGPHVKQDDGSSIRRFEKGAAVYNPMGNGDVTVEFDKPHKSVTTGNIARKHSVSGCDGDILLKVIER